MTSVDATRPIVGYWDQERERFIEIDDVEIASAERAALFLDDRDFHDACQRAKSGDTLARMIVAGRMYELTKGAKNGV